MLVEVDKALLVGCLPDREALAAIKDVPKVFTGDFGNFTVVVLQAKSGLYCGVSKRNPCDRPSETGFCIAAVRAWRDYQGKEAGYSRQHPISKAEAKRISIAAALDGILDRLDID